MAGVGIDIGPLAQAMVNGQIRANLATGEGYKSAQTFQDIYGPNVAAIQYYLEDDVSQQIASLLGGSVVKRKPANYYGKTPDANFISLPGGTEINAGDIASVANVHNAIWGLDDVCAKQQLLSYLIPNAQVTASCAAQQQASNPAQQAQNIADQSNFKGQFTYQDGKLYWGSKLVDQNNKGNSVSTPGQTYQTAPIVPTYSNANQTQASNGVVGAMQSLVNEMGGGILGSKTTIGGIEIPNWALLVGGIGLVWMFNKRS